MPALVVSNARLRWMTYQVATQVAGHFHGAWVPAFRVTRHRLEADSLQLARNALVQPARWQRLLVHRLEQHHAGIALERQPTGEQLVEDDAETIDIAAVVHPMCLAARLFGAHVGDRADYL